MIRPLGSWFEGRGGTPPRNHAVLRAWFRLVTGGSTLLRALFDRRRRAVIRLAITADAATVVALFTDHDGTPLRFTTVAFGDLVDPGVKLGLAGGAQQVVDAIMLGSFDGPGSEPFSGAIAADRSTAGALAVGGEA